MLSLSHGQTQLYLACPRSRKSCRSASSAHLLLMTRLPCCTCGPDALFSCRCCTLHWICGGFKAILKVESGFHLISIHERGGMNAWPNTHDRAFEYSIQIVLLSHILYICHTFLSHMQEFLHSMKGASKTTAQVNTYWTKSKHRRIGRYSVTYS